MKMSTAITMKRCGISTNPQSLVLIYGRGLKTRRRRIRISGLENSSVIETFKELQADESHKQFISLVPKTQLLRLLRILKDLCSGMNLTDSLDRRNEMNFFQNDEDLNSVDYNVMERKDAVMNKLFEQNEMLSTEQDLFCDKEADLPDEPVETYSWDSDECEF
ncbi:unnamed protein product [Schistosoma turkestanicum]|nr:unnamed protein product [Schistosoma turkestanicum]